MQKRSIAERLGAAGGMVTDQRRIVCAVLEKSKDHPDAELIFKRARKADSKIALATVYRSLKALVDLNLIVTHDFGDNRTRYEIKDDDHHDHLVCVSSGKVIEFHNPKLEKLKREIAARLGYSLESHRLELYGRPADVDEQTAQRKSETGASKPS
ncbi:MAG: transcriptional repressor [Pseudomonadota bacterium]